MGCQSSDKAWDRSGLQEECLNFSTEWYKIGQMGIQPGEAIIENDEVQYWDTMHNEQKDCGGRRTGSLLII